MTMITKKRNLNKTSASKRSEKHISTCLLLYDILLDGFLNEKRSCRCKSTISFHQSVSIRVKYSDVQCYGGNFSDQYNHIIYLSEEIQIDQERKSTSNAPLTGVKCKQTNAYTSAILPGFSKSRESISLLFLVPLLLSPFPIFCKLEEKRRLPSTAKLRQTGLELNSERSRLHRNWHFTRAVYHCNL